MNIVNEQPLAARKMSRGRLTDAARRDLAWKALGVAILVFACAAAFAAYLRPDMLINFANLVLCF